MGNLKNRLKIINQLKKNNVSKEQKSSVADIDSLPGWTQCGHKVLKREIALKTVLNTKDKLPQAMQVLVPDLHGRPLPEIKDFLFFDLETTGLSGGAGTVAFLAAFGRFIPDGKLCVIQYLLLDYPGENDFLEAVLKEFADNKTVAVTYNGKTFDSQILKTRCLMNGIRPPNYRHADLLHPARRLWKNIIYDCSQASVETKILGLDRTGDIPGSEAPDIWFEFLKTGKTDRLFGICDHNTADISGLAEMLTAIIKIAGDPLGQKEYNYDIPRLAFFWRFFCCRGKRYLLPQNKNILETCMKLLNHVAKSNYPNNIKSEAQRFISIYERRWKKGIKVR